jgi:hypothetical protein
LEPPGNGIVKDRPNVIEDGATTVVAQLAFHLLHFLCKFLVLRLVVRRLVHQRHPEMSCPRLLRLEGGYEGGAGDLVRMSIGGPDNGHGVGA